MINNSMNWRGSDAWLLESRIVPATWASSSLPGSVTTVTVSTEAGVLWQVQPYGNDFTGGAQIAFADWNGDSIPDVLTIPTSSGTAHIRAYDGLSGVEIDSFFGTDSQQVGAWVIAAGDLNDDGQDEIIIAHGPGSVATVRIIHRDSHQTDAEFLAYSADFLGGVRLAVADINGDGRDDIITVAQAGGGPHVRVFSGVDLSLIEDFFAFDPAFRGGVFLTTFDWNGDARMDVVASAGAGGGPHVKIFDGVDRNILASFFVTEPTRLDGVQLGGMFENQQPKLIAQLGQQSSSRFELQPSSDGVRISEASNETALLPPVLGSSQPEILGFWNDQALRAIRENHTSPAEASRLLALLHLAIFDAVSALEPNYTSGLRIPIPLILTPKIPTQQVAATFAAVEILQAYFPNQAPRWQQFAQAQLRRIDSVEALELGQLLGTSAGRQTLADWPETSPANVVFSAAIAPGKWRPTPPKFEDFADFGWSRLAPFVIPGPGDFRPAGPPPLESTQYAVELMQVLDLGGKVSTTRTPDQTEVAIFWRAGAGTDTPPGMMNRIATSIIATQNLELIEIARVYALLNLAMADAGIVAWDIKEHFETWRPITANAEAGRDFNPATTVIDGWEPLLETPNHPDYVSGHSVFSSAGATILDALFPALTSISVRSPDLPNRNRVFSNVTDAAAEAGLSRIYGGIHLASSNTDGLLAGAAVARYVLENRPLIRTNPTAVG